MVKYETASNIVEARRPGTVRIGVSVYSEACYYYKGDRICAFAGHSGEAPPVFVLPAPLYVPVALNRIPRDALPPANTAEPTSAPTATSTPTATPSPPLTKSPQAFRAVAISRHHERGTLCGHLRCATSPYRLSVKPARHNAVRL